MIKIHYCDARLLPGECILCVGSDPRSVVFETWAGRVRVPCEVLARTPKRYKVRYLATSTCGGGVNRGDIRYVPHRAVLDGDGRPLEGLR